MATKTLQFSYLPGATGLTANVYPVNGGAALNVSGAVTMTESATPGLYQAVMTDLASGQVRVNVLRSGAFIGQFGAMLVEAVGYYDLVDECIVGGFSAVALLAERNNLNGVVITLNGPVLTIGCHLVAILTVGDDFSAADGRNIDLILNGTTLPADLTSSIVQLVCDTSPSDRRRPVEILGSVTVPTGATRTVRFEPAAADTSRLTRTVDGEFWVRITPTSGRVITPAEARGKLIVLAGKTDFCPGVPIC